MSESQWARDRAEGERLGISPYTIKSRRRRAQRRASVILSVPVKSETAASRMERMRGDAKLVLRAASEDYLASDPQGFRRGWSPECRAAAAVRNATTAAKTGRRTREATEAARLEMAGYVGVEQRVVNVRDAVEALVRVGGTRSDILRAMNEGITASQTDDEDPRFAHLVSQSTRPV